MLRKITSILVIIVAGFSVFWVVSAQDDTMTMVTTLEEITADSPAFYGETVTLEGIILDFVNSSSFVLGEDAVIDNDQVLVLNNSGEVLPVQLFTDEFIVITGVVHGSLEFHVDEMMGEADADDMEMDMTGDDILDFYLAGNQHW